MSKKKIIVIVAAAVAAIALFAGLGVYLSSVFSSDGDSKSGKTAISRPLTFSLSNEKN